MKPFWIRNNNQPNNNTEKPMLHFIKAFLDGPTFRKILGGWVRKLLIIIATWIASQGQIFEVTPDFGDEFVNMIVAIVLAGISALWSAFNKVKDKDEKEIMQAKLISQAY